MARTFSTGNSLSVASVVADVPLTISAWIYPTTLGVGQCAVGVGRTGTQNHSHILRIPTVDTIRAQTQQTTAVFAEASGTLSTNVWAHACVVFASSTDRRAYLNGSSSEGTNTTAATPVSMTTTAIGVHTSGVNPFNGRIGEVGIWNVALTAPEIDALARGVSPRLIRPGNLKGYWPVWGAASPEPDLSGSGFNMSLTGTPAQVDHPPTMAYLWSSQRSVVTAPSGANELSGSPTAQAADAAGTMSAPASASGTPQAGAAAADGTLQHVASSSGSPQAGAATADGAATVRIQLSGAPQAGAAVGVGTLIALATLSGAPQAGAAVGDGTAEALVQLSGDPQAGAAVSSGEVGSEAANASGAPQAAAAEGDGTLKAIISMAGTPAASAATSTGLLQHRANLAPPGFTINDDTVNIEFSGPETVETIDVLANDVDPVTGDGSTLIIDTITQPPAGQGSIAINPDGRRIDWTRPAGFVGEVQFTYTAVREYPVPRAGDATSEGLVSPNPNAAGDVEAGASTSEGTIEVIVGLTGAPSAGAATSAGDVGVLVSMQGSPQAQPATGSGFIDDGATPLIAARGRGLIVNVGEILRP